MLAEFKELELVGAADHPDTALKLISKERSGILHFVQNAALQVVMKYQFVQLSPITRLFIQKTEEGLALFATTINVDDAVKDIDRIIAT